ncbi:MAG: hypothetical protein COW01_03435 [Bdellovibrionales bacterium CG12_big_fil_rev_8_21_14_0_65_38_15]|nr:MAG: hypothetical protein COW79_01995 [Bdellovibrionales bacterium CG22_combo_CG10-13_8_21_14_all_38_13]PIQ56897.1 MAG: hypothetical protein COW01_03435 [Bdellovibrionales bacterium CG12_big_fil_rev_8_21_14_0_65_38_15]PIR30062.1 MAG: hypothetical protein COV38_07155 [Bdellovibrionales bacterium CG11_big_fil_rev_8_21_14_0_20_38_13]
MKKLYLSTNVKNNYKIVYAGFDLKLFKALKPPLMDLEVTRFDGCHKGDEVHLKVGLLGLGQDWISHITSHHEDEHECFFIDEGFKIPFPLKSWQHRHIVQKISAHETKIIDDISYSCFGGKVIELLMYPALLAQFLVRAPVYRRFFDSEK